MTEDLPIPACAAALDWEVWQTVRSRRGCTTGDAHGGPDALFTGRTAPSGYSDDVLGGCDGGDGGGDQEEGCT